MRVTAECIPCYLKQCLKAMDRGNWPVEKREEVLVALLATVAGLDRTRTPAENSTIVLHKLIELMGVGDPFQQAKMESNRLALQYLDQLRQVVQRSADPVKQAIRFAVAGNVVDLGLFDNYDLAAALNEVVNSEFKKDDYNQFIDKLPGSEQVLIIGDNSGEIVFDRLLVEVLQAKKVEVVYAVKESFILNDATADDARQAEMDKVSRVITTGNNYLGTIEDKCSREFLTEFRRSPLVISKGQANYESLEGTGLAGDKTFFLLKAKCAVVARNLGVEYGDLVFVQNKLAVSKAAPFNLSK